MKTKIPREEQQQRVEKKKLILPIFIAGILILSVFGYILGSAPPKEETVSYGDYHFYKNVQGWNVRLNDKVLTFVHLPDEVQDISLSEALADYRTTPKIYVASTPVFFSSLAFRDLYTNMLSSQNFQISCLHDVAGCEQYPLKTCADASPQNYVIEFEAAPENSYAYHASCLHVQGTDAYFVRVADRFVFDYFKIANGKD